MTTLNWFKNHLSNMFCPTDKRITYTHGYVSHPTYYSGVGHRDKVFKSEKRFDYLLWDTLVFNAEDMSPFCKNKMSLSYTFYPCYNSVLTRDRLNMIAEILDVPVKFHLEDDYLYADDMKCDFVLVYPHNHEIIYHVHGVDMNNYNRNDYQVIKIYDKKGVRWI